MDINGIPESIDQKILQPQNARSPLTDATHKSRVAPKRLRPLNGVKPETLKLKWMSRPALFVALLPLSAFPFATAQSQPSTAPERTQCKFDDHADVTVEYTSTKMNGRSIFGALVPYGKVWETGYKKPSTFVTSANLVVGGEELPAGHYTLSTIPDPDKWTMVLQKMTSKDSGDPAGESKKIQLTVRRLPSPLETFTISFDQMRGGCVLNLRWEQTEASVLLAEKK